jgi:hypothetical protein
VFLITRPAFASDLAECQHCLRDGFAYDAPARARLVSMWSALLRTGAGSAALIEDVAAPPGRRVRWFCFKAFVPDAYLHWLHTAAPPLIGLGLSREYARGCNPLLSHDEVKSANSGCGLNMVCFHSGAPESTTVRDFMEKAGACLMEFRTYFCTGFRLKSYSVEVYDAYTHAWAEASGLRLRNDYARHRAPATGPAAGREARLYGISATEGHGAAGTLGELLFSYAPPCFGFTRAQRDILTLALTTGDTDEQIADRLAVARVTVKKVWSGAYQRVESASPSFFGKADGGAGVRRGREKRRWLLTYLRHHMEELRPHRPMPPDAEARRLPAGNRSETS